MTTAEQATAPAVDMEPPMEEGDVEKNAPVESNETPSSVNGHERLNHDDASQKDVDQYIRKLSTVLSDPNDMTADDEMLESVVRQAGEYSYGVYAVEVYSFQDPRLLPVGSWYHPELVEAAHHLTQSDDSILQPEICIPGVDLIGWLWSVQHFSLAGKVSSFTRSWTASFRQRKDDDSANKNRPVLNLRNGLCWREFQAVVEDPDVLHGPRLEAMIKLGLDRAAGVMYDTYGQTGMVVYYAKQGIDLSLLTSVANEMYLRRATSMMGSVLAMSEARRASVAFQRQSLSVLGNSEATSEPVTRKFFSRRAYKRVLVWYNKCWGAGSQIPPGMPVIESLWTVLGAFVGLLILSCIDQVFRNTTDYYIVLAPFGALMTLQYGLTGAPASQPRNVVLGTVVAGAISIAFSYVHLPVFWKQIIAPSLSIGAMVKLSITHPPSGAQSVILSAGGHSWGIYGVFVVCSLISVVPATIVNNMSQKRQYPTYWGYVPKGLSKRVVGKCKTRDKMSAT